MNWCIDIVISFFYTFCTVVLHFYTLFLLFLLQLHEFYSIQEEICIVDTTYLSITNFILLTRYISSISWTKSNSTEISKSPDERLISFHIEKKNGFVKMIIIFSFDILIFMRWI